MKAEKQKSVLFINGKIWQENGKFLSSAGIKGNVITYTGNDPGPEMRGDYEEVIDLKKRLVLPAFTDGHVHLVYGSLIKKQIDCTDIKNIAELKERISDYAVKNPSVKWLQGGNMNIGVVLPEADKMENNILDSIYAGRPVFLSNYDYHSGICNTRALEDSGLLSHMEEFKSNEIPRNNRGQPIGIVKEDAMNYVFENTPKASVEEKAQAVDDMINELHSYGITSVSDITADDNLEVYKLLNETDRLKLRINSYIPFDRFDDLDKLINFTKEIPGELFSIKGFKAFYDGALGSGTALFKENYKNSANRGYRTDMAESGQIFELAQKIDTAGKQIIIHAIGDQAVSDVLDLCEKLERKNGARDRRFRIEHAQHIDENDFDRFRKLNVIVSVQPLHLKYDAKIVMEKLPEKTVKRTHNYKKLLERGVVLNFGTDFPIVEINPFKTIHTAVTRNIGDMVFYPENSIDLHNCIKAYTINNAFANFNEKTRGSIKVGKFADLMIMEDDLFLMKPDELRNARVLKTYFNGEEVYSYKEI